MPSHSSVTSMGTTCRMLQGEAGPTSLELCGGTHVSTLGSIGLVRILSEGSVGANTRRIEAVAGQAAHHAIREEDRILRGLEQVVKVRSGGLHERVEKLIARSKALETEIAHHHAAAAEQAGKSLAERMTGSILITRLDGFTPENTRRVVAAARNAISTGVIGVVHTWRLPQSATIAVGSHE